MRYTESKKNEMPPYSVPLLLSWQLLAMVCRLQTCVPHLVPYILEILLQIRKLFLPPDESFKERPTPHPGNRWNVTSQYKNYFKFSKHNGHPTIKIARPHPLPPLPRFPIIK